MRTFLRKKNGLPDSQMQRPSRSQIKWGKIKEVGKFAKSRKIHETIAFCILGDVHERREPRKSNTERAVFMIFG
jgi:hypothetical protein